MRKINYIILLLVLFLSTGCSQRTSDYGYIKPSEVLSNVSAWESPDVEDLFYVSSGENRKKLGRGEFLKILDSSGVTKIKYHSVLFSCLHFTLRALNSYIAKDYAVGLAFGYLGSNNKVGHFWIWYVDNTGEFVNVEPQTGSEIPIYMINKLDLLIML